MTTTSDSHADAARLWALCGLGSCQFWRSTGHGSGWLLPHAALAVSGEPHPLMNWAVVAAGDDPEADLRLFVARPRELHLPGYILLASAVADELEPTARELRLHGPHTTPLMRRDSGAASPNGSDDLAVAVVHDRTGLRDVIEVAAAAFDVSSELLERAWDATLLDALDLDVFLARRGSEPLSCVFTTRTGSAIGLWAMATAPAHQRQGAGRLLLSQVLSCCGGRADYFYLFATSAGRRLYESLGFAVVDEAANWDVL